MNLIYFQELKYRILYSLGGIFCIFFISYTYVIQIVYLLTTLILIDIQQQIYIYYIYTKITDLLYSYFNLIFIILIIYSLLIICYHFFFFFKPGFYKNEFKQLKTNLLFIIIFYSFFLLFASIYLFPKIYIYFLNYNQIKSNTLNIFFELNIINFLNFLKFFFLICILCVSILQIYIYILKQTNISFLLFRKISIIFNIIISTIITPPDFLNQIYVFFFLITIVEILILIKMFLKFYFKQFLNYF